MILNVHNLFLKDAIDEILYKFDWENPKWIFGQYALALLEKVYEELINKMKNKGWI